MNTITVIAQGAPGSLARRVQIDPGIAVGMYQALKAVQKEYGEVLPKTLASQVNAAIKLAEEATPQALFPNEEFPP